MSLDLYGRLLLALVAVLVLLVGFAWLARRLGLAGRNFAAAGRRRLAIVEVAPIDNKRRLILVRRDATEHLVLLGEGSALLVESGIAAPEVDASAPPTATPRGVFAAMLKGSGS
jgi:flagellar protein FliO/FliZ